MGIKKLKEFCKSEYIFRVSMYSGEIQIGSSLCHNLITIKKDYQVKWSSILSAGGKAEALRDKLLEMKEDGSLKDIIEAKDTFENLKVVYTSSDGKIIKKWCEEYGWANTTTDGELMYDNNFFKTRLEALKYEKSDLGYKFRSIKRNTKDSFFALFKQLKWMSETLVQFFRVYVLRGY